jgi:very-short-patch-repair endonuclease
MTFSAVLPQVSEPVPILDRHATRRKSGIPTITVLVGPMGAGLPVWRRWAGRTGRSVIVARANEFPHSAWARAVAEQIDVPVAAVHSLARRARRDPDEFLTAWRTKTSADRKLLCNALDCQEDDDLLWALAALANDDYARGMVTSSLCALGRPIVPIIVRLAPSFTWPAVLFIVASVTELSALAQEAVTWAGRVPCVPIAIAVSGAVWADYLAATPDSRVKALLREGELAVPAIDGAVVEEGLTHAGVQAGVAAMLAANGADAILVDSAAALAKATLTAPESEADDNRARSLAEQFLFEFLQSMSDTVDRFKLNATLDFRFGTRLAEVDLLCRQPPVAVEIDGYFHFRDAVAYRRDRAKDWELQRRGYRVLRFLAEDVIPHLEIVRDRILDALTKPADSP